MSYILYDISLLFFVRFLLYFLWALVLFPVISMLCLMAYLLFPMFLQYLPWAHPKYHQRLSIVFLLGSQAISYAFYGGSYGFITIIQCPFSCGFFSAYYGVYGNPYGLSCYFMCFLQHVLLFICYHPWFLMVSLVPPMGAPVISKATYSKFLLFKGYSLCSLRHFEQTRRARQ